MVSGVAQAPTWGTHQVDRGPHLFAAAPLDFNVASRAGWDFVERSQLPSAIKPHPTFSFSPKGASASPRGRRGPELGLGCHDSVLQTCHLAGEPKATHVCRFSRGWFLLLVLSAPPPPSPPFLAPSWAMAPSGHHC